MGLITQFGNDTTGAMFKYIDNKTERAGEATINTLAAKDDIIAVRKEISKSKVDITIKWMFIFWVGRVAASLAIIFLLVKKLYLSR